MKTFLTYSLITLICGTLQAKQEVTVLPEVSMNIITITGTTNISTFHLNYQENSTYRISLLQQEINTLPDSNIHEIVLPLDNFRMANSLMKDDFMELMKAKTFPNLFIQINHQELLALSQDNPNLEITITMAGVTKKLSVVCKKNDYFGNRIILSGCKTVQLSDFNIVPKSYFGLIRVSNDIMINFAFCLYDHH